MSVVKRCTHRPACWCLAKAEAASPAAAAAAMEDVKRLALEDSVLKHGISSVVKRCTHRTAQGQVGGRGCQHCFSRGGHGPRGIGRCQYFECSIGQYLSVVLVVQHRDRPPTRWRDSRGGHIGHKAPGTRRRQYLSRIYLSASALYSSSCTPATGQDKRRGLPAPLPPPRRTRSAWRWTTLRQSSASCLRLRS